MLGYLRPSVFTVSKFILECDEKKNLFKIVSDCNTFYLYPYILHSLYIRDGTSCRFTTKIYYIPFLWNIYNLVED